MPPAAARRAAKASRRRRTSSLSGPGGSLPTLARLRARTVLVHCFDQALRLLHPIVEEAIRVFENAELLIGEVRARNQRIQERAQEDLATFRVVREGRRLAAADSDRVPAGAYDICGPETTTAITLKRVRFASPRV